MSRVALVAGMAAVIVFSTTMAYGNQTGARPLDLLGYALLGTCALGLAWPRSRPEGAVVVCSLAAAACFLLGYAYAFWPVPALVAVFLTISSGRRAWGWAGVAFLVAVPGVGVLLSPETGHLVALLVWGLLAGLVAQLAEVSRARRAYTAEVEHRMVEAERTREEEARRRAQDERLKIARELHDVTSHTIALIALHASVAAEAVDRAGGPEAARDALKIIRTASREALAEMKGVLGVLRADGPEPRAPAPGGGQLAELAATAGLPVHLEVTGESRPLPPSVDLTLYRVVQEALTNTMRHAGATSATVGVRYETGGVVVQVDDDGTVNRVPEHGAGSGKGHGLAGMAERVEAVGGRLTVGRRPEGGFQVVAWLPA